MSSNYSPYSRAHAPRLQTVPAPQLERSPSAPTKSPRASMQTQHSQKARKTPTIQVGCLSTHWLHSLRIHESQQRALPLFQVVILEPVHLLCPPWLLLCLCFPDVCNCSQFWNFFWPFQIGHLTPFLGPCLSAWLLAAPYLISPSVLLRNSQLYLQPHPGPYARVAPRPHK